MKKYLYKICTLLILSINTNAQIVEVNYHFGYDCTKTLARTEIRGGCSTDISTKYYEVKKSNKINSKEIKTVKKFRPFSNGKFAVNQLEDSLNIKAYKHNISINEITKILDLVSTIETAKDTSNNLSLFHPQEIGEWNSETLGTSVRKLKKTNTSLDKESKFKSINDLNKYYKEILIEENQSVAISSVTEILEISINYDDNNVSISQSNPGKLNIEWLIEINSVKYRIISAEFNSILNEVLSKHFQIRNRLLEFRKIDNILNSINK